MKRVLAAMAAAFLMVALVSGATLAGGGNSANAKVCQKGGYRQSATIIGAFSGTVGPFTTQGACVRYGAHGRVVYVPIGVVLPSSWAMHEAWLGDALAAAGYSAQILFSEDPATERAAVKTLIRRGVKVLILTPQDGAAAADAADAARHAGVKVINYDRLVIGTRSVDYYVTFDLMAVGGAQAQFLIDRAGRSSGNSLYLYAGGAYDNNSFLFFEGAWETLQPRIADGTFVIMNSSEALALKDKLTLTRAERAAVIAEIDTQWSFGVAHALAIGNLAAAPPANDTAFILGPNDETAGAISDAFAARPVATFYVTGQDANQSWVQRLIDGTQGMTVFKDPRTLAKDAVAAARAFLKGHTPAASTTFDNGAIDVPSLAIAGVAVTVDNLQAALIDTGFYQAGDFTGTWPGKP